jgi:hypothetical protein
MVASLSKNHGFSQETALALRTCALAVQFSYDRKGKSLNVRGLMNKGVAKHCERNFHWKTLVSFWTKESNLQDRLKMIVFHAKWISQVAKYHRVWNINGISNWNTEWNGSRSRQAIIFEWMDPMEASWSFFIFSSLSNVLTPTLNITETVSIILKFRLKFDVNLVQPYTFLSRKWTMTLWSYSIGDHKICTSTGSKKNVYPFSFDQRDGIRYDL